MRQWEREAKEKSRKQRIIDADIRCGKTSSGRRKIVGIGWREAF